MALVAAANTAGPACQIEGQPGFDLVVNVRFLPTGHATDSKVEGPVGQTQTGLCIARRFDQVTINAFAGEPVALSARVVVP
jgi:hypothetical protein